MKYDVIRDGLPKQDATFDACFAFSLHKCGSSLLAKMIMDVCRQAKIPSVSVPGLAFREGYRDMEWAEDPQMMPVFQRNLLYYGFRFLPAALTEPEIKLRTRRFTLLVRDPRDALVSEYFSYGKKSGSHALPPKNQDAFKASMAAQGEGVEIDDYVLRVAHNLVRKLTRYREALNFDLGLLARYEDIFFDKETYLGAVFAHFGIDVAPEIIASVAAANDIRPEAEDETQHIRKGTPGDHREKLKPETIAQLNDMFRDVSAFYGYAL